MILGCPGWLPGQCYVGTKVSGMFGVCCSACSGVFLGDFIVFWMVSKVLLGDFRVIARALLCGD